MLERDNLLIKPYTKDIAFFVYATREKIIDKAVITKWVDEIIKSENSVPFFMYDLSIAMSLNDQFDILSGIAVDCGITDRDADPKRIISQLKIMYNSDINLVLSTISNLYKVRFDVNVNREIEDDIYILDDYKDFFSIGGLSLHLLKDKLDAFLKDF